MSDNKHTKGGLDDLLVFHKQFDDMIENTPLKKEDAVHELISLCTGWLKNNKVSKEAVTEIILDAYEEWLSEEEAEAHKTIVSKAKVLKDQLDQQSY